MARSGYVEGGDLMLYINTSASNDNPVYVAQAAATNHTITYTGEAKERITKDTANGAFSEKRVTKLSVQIKADALVIFGEDFSYDRLVQIMKGREVVKLKYGFAQEQAGDKYEEGLFVITSLEQSSQAGEDATCSATFDNTGEIKTQTKK